MDGSLLWFLLLQTVVHLLAGVKAVWGLVKVKSGIVAGVLAGIGAGSCMPGTCTVGSTTLVGHKTGVCSLLLLSCP